MTCDWEVIDVGHDGRTRLRCRRCTREMWSRSVPHRTHRECAVVDLKRRPDAPVANMTVNPDWRTRTRRKAHPVRQFARAVWRWARAGFPRADRAERLMRRAICASCEHERGLLLRRCGACGCFLALKQRWPTERCPLGKWERPHKCAGGCVGKAADRQKLQSPTAVLEKPAENSNETKQVEGCAGCGHADPSAPPLPAPLPVRPRSASDRPSLLLHYNYGLGDAVQITTILLHLRHYFPEWDIDMLAPNGHYSLYHGLCRRSINLHREQVDRSQYTLVRDLMMLEPDETFADCPSTKAERMLKRLFQLEPIKSLCRYEIQPGQADTDAAHECLDRLGVWGERFLLLHYQGYSHKRWKDLDERTAWDVCDTAHSLGCRPVILDLDGTSGIDDQRIVRIHKSDPLWAETGVDAARLFALGQQAALCVGIDSGPGHIWSAYSLTSEQRERSTAVRSAALRSPSTVIAWPTTYLHPLHYFGLAEHVTHAVTPDHALGIADTGAGRQAGADYFARSYRHHICERGLRHDLPALVAGLLVGDTYIDVSRAAASSPPPSREVSNLAGSTAYLSPQECWT